MSRGSFCNGRVIRSSGSGCGKGRCGTLRSGQATFAAAHGGVATRESDAGEMFILRGAKVQGSAIRKESKECNRGILEGRFAPIEHPDVHGVNLNEDPRPSSFSCT
jgi:hypothetical protein